MEACGLLLHVLSLRCRREILDRHADQHLPVEHDGATRDLHANCRRQRAEPRFQLRGRLGETLTEAFARLGCQNLDKRRPGQSGTGDTCQDSEVAIVMAYASVRVERGRSFVHRI